MTTALVFPGQGSQAVGMGLALAEAFPAAREVFQEVDEALGCKLSDIMKDGPEAELTRTENAQPAIMAVSMAAFRVMEKEMGFTLGVVPPPVRGRLGGGHYSGETSPYSGPLPSSPLQGEGITSCVAGHSLGEYSALTAAGAFSLSQCAKLLKIRGSAMQAAVPEGKGGMVAIIGPDFSAVEEIVREARNLARGEVIEIANQNSTNQTVISGSARGMEVAIEVAREKGAKRVLPLPVSAPFHCSLMAPAAMRMREALASETIQSPRVPLVANVTAEQVSDPALIKELLAAQVTGTVRWVDSVLAMQAAGVTRMIEVGHGNILAGLIKRIAPEIAVINIASPQDLERYHQAA